ncbi:MAG: RNA-binding S4 domain-containing protein [Firmicutes bacterium]|nr:RNA-binding S4 domain-containing protein [Bacillota bacterium]
MRIDKYLKISRLIKRRTVAHDACEQTRIYINDKAVKPGAQVKAGDKVMIRFGNSELTVRVLATPEHVTKDGAAELYEVISE